jgi:hypothetical protein
MCILMAIGAALEFLYPEVSNRASVLCRCGCLVALRAWHLRVSPLKREPRGRMDKGGGGKTVLGVARLACIAVRTSGKLATVRIFVAIRALLELLHGESIARSGLRPPAAVAPFAFQGCMLPAQWKPGRAMIERPCRDIGPPPGIMAALAALLKLPAMGIGMAGGTVGKLHARVFHRLPIRKETVVASGAFHDRMPSGQAKLCGVMNKPGCRLPAVGDMALLTLW